MASFFRTPKHKQFNYKPRYYNPEEEERQIRNGEKPIRMERGSFFKQKNRSQLVGAFTENDIAFRKRVKGTSQWSKVFVLVLILCLPILYILEITNSLTSISFLVILLIFYFSKMNRGI